MSFLSLFQGPVPQTLSDLLSPDECRDLSRLVTTVLDSTITSSRDASTDPSASSGTAAHATISDTLANSSASTGGCMRKIDFDLQLLLLLAAVRILAGYPVAFKTLCEFSAFALVADIALAALLEMTEDGWHSFPHHTLLQSRAKHESQPCGSQHPFLQSLLADIQVWDSECQASTGPIDSALMGTATGIATPPTSRMAGGVVEDSMGSAIPHTTTIFSPPGHAFRLAAPITGSIILFSCYDIFSLAFSPMSTWVLINPYKEGCDTFQQQITAFYDSLVSVSMAPNSLISPSEALKHIDLIYCILNAWMRCAGKSR